MHTQTAVQDTSNALPGPWGRSAPRSSARTEMNCCSSESWRSRKIPARGWRGGYAAPPRSVLAASSTTTKKKGNVEYRLQKKKSRVWCVVSFGLVWFGLHVYMYIFLHSSNFILFYRFGFHLYISLSARSSYGLPGRSSVLFFATAVVLKENENELSGQVFFLIFGSN